MVWSSLIGVEVDVEGAAHRRVLRVVGRVEELPVALDLEAELVAVVDLEPVEVLVLQASRRRARGRRSGPGLLRLVRMWISSGRSLDEGGEAGAT